MASENIDFDYYFLDIIKHRNISNAIAERFKIRHESPQLLVFKNGKVIAHDSHYAILEMKY
jgi:bacillithiol system protein YtxJ